MALLDFAFAAAATMGPLFFLMSSSDAEKHPNGYVLASRSGFLYLYYCAAKYIALAIVTGVLPFLQTPLEIVASGADAFVLSYWILGNAFSDSFDFKSRIAGMTIGWAIAHAFTFEAISYASPLLGETPFSSCLVFSALNALTYLGVAYAISNLAHIINRIKTIPQSEVNSWYALSVAVAALPAFNHAVFLPLARMISGSPSTFLGAADESGVQQEVVSNISFDGMTTVGAVIYVAVNALTGAGCFYVGELAKKQVLLKPTKADAVGNEEQVRKGAVSVMAKAMKSFPSTQ